MCDRISQEDLEIFLLFLALRRARVIFKPMVWSTEGRPRPETSRLLDAAVRTVRSRRRRRDEDAAALQQRWRHEITVAIQRRKAAMLKAVLPQHSDRQEWLARGGAPRICTTLRPLDDGADGVVECDGCEE